VIVTKDTDFHHRCFLYGPPPKVVWLRVGNCSTDTVESVLRARAGDIEGFHDDESASLLVLD
jgi:predicted nuclease of predicted toxin-antitoxin system